MLFDAVGTLLYADPPVAEVYGEAGRRYGVTLPVDEIAKRFSAALRTAARRGTTSSEDIERRRWKSIVADVCRELPDREVGLLFEELWRHFSRPQSWRLFDDVESALRRLHRAGFRLAIASNFDARLGSVCVGHPPLRSLDWFWSSALGYAKPDRRFFRAIEHRLGGAPEQLTLVGDDWQADIQGATCSGWKAIFLDRQGGREASVPTVRSLNEIPAPSV